MLNDLTSNADRRDAFEAFRSWLAPGGVLVADVREWDATARRRARGLRHERIATEGEDTLRYASETTLDGERRLMRVHERYAGSVNGAQVDETYEFVMRCWTADEVRDLGARAGFTTVEVLRGGDAGIAPDRLLVIAAAESTRSACALS